MLGQLPHCGSGGVQLTQGQGGQDEPEHLQDIREIYEAVLQDMREISEGDLQDMRDI